LQGNSGVAVANEPPAEAGDSGVLSLWVAFAAGLMALVSTTPLAKLRQGIGGMLISGATGGGRGAPAPKPAPKPASKAAPPEKDKEKKPKKPAAPAPASIGPSEARFITKVVPEPAPIFPSEARFITKVEPKPVYTEPSEARFITKVVPEPAPVFPSEARFITKVEPEPAPVFPSEARFIREVSAPPTLAPVPTPPKPQVTATPQPHTPHHQDQDVSPIPSRSETQSFGERVMARLPSALTNLIRDGDLARLLQGASGLPDITVALPMLRGFGFDEVSGPLLKEIDSDFTIRALGRAIGEPLLSPVALTAGYLITLYPEFRENVETTAPLAEFVADAVVDSVGFGVGEAAGDIAGSVALESGPGAIAAKLTVDVGVGFAYDLAVDDLGVRDWLTAELVSWGERQQPDEEPPLAPPQPPPTPPTASPTRTPAPP